MYPKIDYSDLENIEPVPGRRLEGWKIVGHYRRDSADYSHLVIAEDANGLCEAVNLTDDGREWSNDLPLIRNKPKRVRLEECWVVYTPDGQYRITVFSEEAAEWAAGNCGIIRHIPAEEREIECGTQS